MSIEQVYFAYGSNLHPIRFQRTIGRRVNGTKSILRGAILSFNKRGIDGSGKCSIRFTQASSSAVVGVAYEVNAGDAERIDQWEGATCGYRRIDANVDVDGRRIAAFTYIAPDVLTDPELLPFHWYKQYVVLGALCFRFPPAYIDQLRKQRSIPDTDSSRSRRNAALLAELGQVSAGADLMGESERC